MKKARSLKNKLNTSISIIVILQIIVIVGVIFAVGTPDILDQGTVNGLKTSIETKGEQVDERIRKWSELKALENSVNKYSENMAYMAGKSVSEFTSDDDSAKRFLTAATVPVLQTLRNNGVTDCFVILNGGDETRYKNALYLFDADPEHTALHNEDIFVEAGPSRNLLNKGFSISEHWSDKVLITESDDFYQKPFRMAQENQGFTTLELEYFSPSVDIDDDGMSIITYTMPLVAQDGEAYGVIGVGISVKFLSTILKSGEIGIDEDGCYYMGCLEPNGSVRTAFVGESPYNAVIPAGGTIFLDQVRSLHDVESIRGTSLFISTYDCKIYQEQSPYGEQWYLGAVVDRAAMRYASNRLILALLLALVASLTISFGGAALMVQGIVKPIKVLMRGLSQISPDHVELPRTNIREFDELSDVVVKQTKESYKAGSKVADIIQRADVQIGIIEIVDGADNFFITQKAMEMLDLPFTNWKDNYISIQDYHEELDMLRRKFTEDEDNNVYQFQTKDGTPRWLNIQIIMQESGRLCIFTDVTKDFMERQKIRHERDYDILTGLYNRRAFRRIVTDLFQKGKCKTGVMSIWDLDNLKYINDTYGHDMGDKYICTMANAFNASPGGGFIKARMAGDEFMCFAYGESVPLMLERMKNIHKSFCSEMLELPDGKKIAVSVSGGMSVYGTQATDFDDLVKYADFAMYEIKHKSKGAIKCFEKDSYIKDYILIQGVEELNRIVKEESVRYVYQPIISLEDYSVFAYEALMRPVSEMLKNPVELLRVAESQSKLGQIEKITWIHAMEGFFSQITPADVGVRLFLNSIPKQCLTGSEFENLVKRYGKRIKQIVVEITENAKMEDSHADFSKQEWCRAHEIPFALDDFGSGYSNTDILMHEKFAFVKLDMNLVRNIHLMPSSQQYVKSVIEYCHTNGIQVIAEGVEKLDELRVIEGLGADFVQGYYFAKPGYDIKSIQIKREKEPGK